MDSHSPPSSCGRCWIAEVIVAPPLLHLLQVKSLLEKSSHPDIKVSAQNAYHKPQGAFTGGELEKLSEGYGPQVSYLEGL